MRSSEDRIHPSVHYDFLLVRAAGVAFLFSRRFQGGEPRKAPALSCWLLTYQGAAVLRISLATAITVFGDWCTHSRLVTISFPRGTAQADGRAGTDTYGGEAPAQFARFGDWLVGRPPDTRGGFDGRVVVSGAAVGQDAATPLELSTSQSNGGGGTLFRLCLSIF